MLLYVVMILSNKSINNVLQKYLYLLFKNKSTESTERLRIRTGIAIMSRYIIFFNNIYTM